MKQRLYLLWLLSRVHLRSSDYRSIFGIFWSFTGPLITFFVFYLVFQDPFGRRIPLYSLKLLTGVIAVTFFNQCAQLCIQSVQYSRNLLMVSLVPASAVIFSPLSTAFCRVAAGLALCLIIAAVHGLLTLKTIPLIVLYFFLLCLFASGVGLIIGTLSVLASDAGEIWLALSPLVIFVTPVFYSLDMLSKWSAPAIAWLNPLSAYILVLQTALSDQPVPGMNLWVYVYPWVSSGLFLSAGWLFYKKFQKHLLEI